ncbi:adenylosuccinate lyase [Actinocatenispora thailandica]|uniref:Adenylosuccinate lyase n=1 Tax=Actinocatenispora thailandica TaxID=227318 RepID=A0A7R7DLU3_9ACTN|nr:adenylosuccinate lyase family protein [Actinocatenispora thailandica]BCJ33871.1 adenylosuccinate lyase [Actinocatenispora thailandica]
MGAHPADSLLYRHLWSTEEIHRYFDDKGRIKVWLQILSALASAQSEVGIIPHEAAVAIAAHADVELFDLEEVACATRATGHSTFGLIRSLRCVLPEEAAEWVYYGATVQDLTDTWTALTARYVLDIVDRDLGHLLDTIAGLAIAHRDTVMCGRTHGQPGLPITFGFKAAVWASELSRHRERLRDIRPRIEVVQLGGALGTMEFWMPESERLLSAFAARLGLGVPDIPWITARDGVAEFLGFLGMMSSTLAKIGQEVYELQRPEIGELAETWTPGQVGSITMPHKRNPELSEHLVTLAKVIRSNAGLGLEAMVHEHERDGRSWKTEWLAVPEACLLACTALVLCCRLADGLQVNADRMKDNVDACAGYLMSEPVMRVLSAKIGKHSAHTLIYEATMNGRANGLSMRDALLANREVLTHLSVSEIDASLDLDVAVGAAGMFVDRVLKTLDTPRSKNGGAR